MREQIRETLAEVFERPVADVPSDATNQTLEGWDSLRHLELMLALEMKFGVRMTSAVIPTLLSVDAIEDYLREQGTGA